MSSSRQTALETSEKSLHQMQHTSRVQLGKILEQTLVLFPEQLWYFKKSSSVSQGGK